ncbi:unnamed protein product [Parajaminaea phylloscopi]
MPPERRSQVAAASAATVNSASGPGLVGVGPSFGSAGTLLGSPSTLSGTPALAYTSRRIDECSAYDEQVSRDLDEVGDRLLQQEPRADGGPRRPMNAFLIYARWRRMQMAKEREREIALGINVERESILVEQPPSPGGTIRKRKRKAPGTKPSDVSAALGEEWSKLSPELQRPFHRKANQLRADFDAQHPEYKFTRGPKGVAKQRRLEKSHERAMMKRENKASGNSSPKVAATPASSSKSRVRDVSARPAGCLDGLDVDPHRSAEYLARPSASSAAARSDGHQAPDFGAAYDFYSSPPSGTAVADMSRFKRQSAANVHGSTARELPQLPPVGSTPSSAWRQLSPSRGHQRGSSRHSLADLGLGLDSRLPARRAGDSYSEQSQLFSNPWSSGTVASSTSPHPSTGSANAPSTTSAAAATQQPFRASGMVQTSQQSPSYGQLAATSTAFPTLTQPDWPTPRPGPVQTTPASSWHGHASSNLAQQRYPAVEINQFHHSWPSLHQDHYSTSAINFQPSWQGHLGQPQGPSNVGSSATSGSHGMNDFAAFHVPGLSQLQPYRSYAQATDHPAARNAGTTTHHPHQLASAHTSGQAGATQQSPSSGTHLGQTHARTMSGLLGSSQGLYSRSAAGNTYPHYNAGSLASSESAGIFDQQSRTWGSTLTGNFPSFSSIEPVASWSDTTNGSTIFSTSDAHGRILHKDVHTEALPAATHSDAALRLAPIESRADLSGPSSKPVTASESQNQAVLEDKDGDRSARDDAGHWRAFDPVASAPGSVVRVEDGHDPGRAADDVAQGTTEAESVPLIMSQQSAESCEPSKGHTDGDDSQSMGMQTQFSFSGTLGGDSSTHFGATRHSYELSLAGKWADPRRVSTASGLPAQHSSLSALFESSGPHSATGALEVSASNAMSFSSPAWHASTTATDKVPHRQDAHGAAAAPYEIKVEESSSDDLAHTTSYQPEEGAGLGIQFAFPASQQQNSKDDESALHRSLSTEATDSSTFAHHHDSLHHVATLQSDSGAIDGHPSAFYPGRSDEMRPFNGHASMPLPYDGTTSCGPPSTLGGAVEGLRTQVQERPDLSRQLSSHGRERDAVLSASYQLDDGASDDPASALSQTDGPRQLHQSRLYDGSSDSGRGNGQHDGGLLRRTPERSDRSSPPTAPSMGQHKRISSITNVLDFWKSPTIDPVWMPARSHEARTWNEGAAAANAISPAVSDSPSPRPLRQDSIGSGSPSEDADDGTLPDASQQKEPDSSCDEEHGLDKEEEQDEDKDPATATATAGGSRTATLVPHRDGRASSTSLSEPPECPTPLSEAGRAGDGQASPAPTEHSCS